MNERIDDQSGHWPDWQQGGREIHDFNMHHYLAMLQRPGLSDESREEAHGQLAVLEAYRKSQLRDVAVRTLDAQEKLAALERQCPGIDEAMSAEKNVAPLRQQFAEEQRYFERRHPDIYRDIFGQGARVIPLVCRPQRRGRPEHGGPAVRRAAGGSRARSPGRSDDPPGESDPGLTPLQQAQLLLLKALVQASEGGRRTFLTFLDIAVIRLAAEVARTTDWDDRP